MKLARVLEQHREPEDESTEAEIETMWRRLLHLPCIGPDEDFFAIGGNSLAVGQILARVHDRFGSRISWSAFYERPTIAGLAAAVRRGQAPRDPAFAVTPAEQEQPRTRHPLSSAQQRVWFLEQMDPGLAAYRFQTVIHFRGQLDLGILERALSEIVRRHTIFRSTFHSHEGAPVQDVHEAPLIHLGLTDFSPLPEGERDAASQRLRDFEFAQPFDLANGPLVRWSVHRIDADNHRLLHQEHHLVHDGWSFYVFLAELVQLYGAFADGLPSPLPEPPQFCDHAAAEEKWLESPEARDQLDFWRDHLRADVPPLPLPCDRPQPARSSFAGSSILRPLPLPLCRALRRFCRAEGVSMYAVLLAGFHALLHRFTGEALIATGCGVANRKSRQSEGLIGMLVNNVVIQSDLAGDPSFVDLVRATREKIIRAHDNSEAPFDRVVTALGIPPGSGRNPLFQVMFNFHDSPLPDVRLPGVDIDVQNGISNGSAKFDLNIIVVPHSPQLAALGSGRDPDSIEILWEYSTDLFEAGTIERLFACYVHLVEAAVTNPSETIDVLPLADPAETTRQLTIWNDTRRDYPREATVHA
ncbi:MAG: condensation domain-containing protein, partial [Opitutaceae bacterium]